MANLGWEAASLLVDANGARADITNLTSVPPKPLVTPMSGTQLLI